MKEYLVLSLLGPDRPGLVDRITEVLARCHANLEDSRMAVLGSEFAMMILVSMEPEVKKSLLEGVAHAAHDLGLLFTCKPTQPRSESPGRSHLVVEVRGMDHEGIVHEVAHYLVGQGMSVETLDSTVTHAPHSGTPLFAMKMRLEAPGSVSPDSLRQGLARVGDRLNVDIEVFEGQAEAAPRGQTPA
ncbi:MAG TPA: ACT domain-containing protein [Candidatus Nitrosotenuis sp.]|jgi:glycine cleavage system transcriptional repressor|nr:ACT domain-containing protein [Candidatus Nitrosotenuis sp.]